MVKGKQVLLSAYIEVHVITYVQNGQTQTIIEIINIYFNTGFSFIAALLEI